MSLKVFKYILYFIISLYFLNISVFSCEYKADIERCENANKNGTAKSIEDFSCIQWSYEDIASQVVLDSLFSEIDLEMDNYIFELEKNKNLYFWPEKTKNFVEGIDNIYKKRDYFYYKYILTCKEVAKETSSCMVDGVISNDLFIKFSGESWSLCRKLVETKMSIYDDVTWSIMIMNSLQVNLDYKKLYDQVQRSDYNRVIDLMIINLWYIERIISKLPSFTKNTY